MELVTFYIDTRELSDFNSGSWVRYFSTYSDASKFCGTLMTICVLTFADLINVRSHPWDTDTFYVSQIIEK